MVLRVSEREEGFFARLMGDGRPMLFVCAGALFFAGGFAVFVSASHQFLPHDLAYLGMSSEELCAVSSCRVVDFMTHDRVAWGGMMMGLAVMYAWLIAFPLSAGRGWAWWAFLCSWVIGGLAFASYLGTGYLDTWNGAGTLLLAVPLVLGLWRSRRLVVAGERGFRALVRPVGPAAWERAGLGRVCMLLAALAMGVGGLVILGVGARQVFVSQDMVFMHMTREQLLGVNARLVSLIAHDRQGFGGTVAALGLTAAACIWCAPKSRALWQALFVAWLLGAGGAVGVHIAVGYTDTLHLAPAVIGAAAFGLGLALSARAMLVVRPGPPLP